MAPLYKRIVSGNELSVILKINNRLVGNTIPILTLKEDPCYA